MKKNVLFAAKLGLVWAVFAVGVLVSDFIVPELGGLMLMLMAPFFMAMGVMHSVGLLEQASDAMLIFVGASALSILTFAVMPPQRN